MEKKTKLTISGSAKKSIRNIEIAKTQGKNSVVIEKSKTNFVFRPIIKAVTISQSEELFHLCLFHK